MGKSGARTDRSATTTADQLLLSKTTTVPISMKLITIYVYILSRVVNPRFLPLSAKVIFAAEEQWVGKASVLLCFAVCQTICVNSTFSHHCTFASPEIRTSVSRFGCLLTTTGV